MAIFDPEELAKIVTKWAVTDNLKSPLPNDPSLPQFIPPYVHYTKNNLHYVEKRKSGSPNPEEETPTPITFTDEEFDKVLDKRIYEIVETIGKFCFGNDWKTRLHIVEVTSIMETLIKNNKIRFIVMWYVPSYIVEDRPDLSTKEFDGGIDVVFEVEIGNPNKEDILTFFTIKGLADYRLVYDKDRDQVFINKPKKPDTVLEAEKIALENNKATMQKNEEDYEKGLEKLSEEGVWYEENLDQCNKLRNEIDSVEENIKSAGTDIVLAHSAATVTTSTGAGWVVNAIPIQLSNLKKFANLIAKSLAVINNILNKLHLETYARRDPKIQAIFIGIRAVLNSAEAALLILGG